MPVDESTVLMALVLLSQVGCGIVSVRCWCRCTIPGTILEVDVDTCTVRYEGQSHTREYVYIWQLKAVLSGEYDICHKKEENDEIDRDILQYALSWNEPRLWQG